MAVPLPYDITIYVNEVDVTPYIFHYNTLAFEDYARQVSTFAFTLYNPVGITPARHHPVYVTANSLPDAPIIFLGYIKELVGKKHDNGIAKLYEINCVDMKDRLLNSIIGTNEFTGSDIDILGDLLSNTYPDLSDLFDFSTGATGFIDDLTFAVEDGTSLLDALNDLADVTGADYRFEEVATTSNAITFDSDADLEYTVDAQAGVGSHGVVSGGNPDNCYNNAGSYPAANDQVTIIITYDTPIEFNDFSLDYFFTAVDGSTRGRLVLTLREGGFNVENGTILQTIPNDATWHTYTLADQAFGIFTPPYTVDEVQFKMDCITGGPSTAEMRMDNIIVNPPFVGGDPVTGLQWNDEADAADFDIDVQNSDEFAADIDLFEGDFGDFNSVTVIGGYGEIAIDKALDSDGVRDHLSLPYPVKDLAVYVNTGTDTTPAWGSALDLGAWGSDTLTGDGGTKDVLHDAVHNWLYFDTAPSNLVNSWRITGSIQRPIRIRVETGEEPVLAKPYVDETITSVDEAVLIGQAQLDSRSAIRRLDFITPHPGLKPGQAMTVTDSARGLSETLVIQKISTKWLGSSGHAEFHVECGDEETTGIDSILANVDRRSRQLATNTSPDTQVANLLTSDGVVITSDGIAIYSIG